MDTHLDEQVDSFILHVKAAMLLSRVKIFNGRYKKRKQLGDPALIPDPAGLPTIPRPDLIQTTPAFVEIDKLIVSYLGSFPPHLKDPLANGVIDNSLLTAISSAHLWVMSVLCLLDPLLTVTYQVPLSFFTRDTPISDTTVAFPPSKSSRLHAQS